MWSGGDQSVTLAARRASTRSVFAGPRNTSFNTSPKSKHIVYLDLRCAFLDIAMRHVVPKVSDLVRVADDVDVSVNVDIGEVRLD